MVKNNNCTAFCFKRDISELCGKCPLVSLITEGIENQIVSQAMEQQEILSQEQFQSYINTEVENAKAAMQRVFLTEQQNKDYKNDKHRIKRTEIYIWNKERIKALNHILNPERKLKRTGVELLTSKLEESGFKNIEKVSCLSNNGQSQLIKLLFDNDLPYKIAMFDFLGFLDFVYKENNQIKIALNKEIAKILDSNERAIKGNISVLTEHSKEDRTRYTSFNYREIVKKDYNGLI